MAYAAANLTEADRGRPHCLPLVASGRNSGGRPGYGGRVTSAREMALNSDGSFSYGRGSVGSGHASPQVMPRAPSPSSRALLIACWHVGWGMHLFLLLGKAVGKDVCSGLPSIDRSQGLSCFHRY